MSFTRRRKNDAIVALVRIAIAIASRLPKRALISCGGALGRAAFYLLPRERRIALENLQIAFPDQSPKQNRATAKQAYFTLGKTLGEAATHLAETPPTPTTTSTPTSTTTSTPTPIPFLDSNSSRALFDAIADGRGVLLASAHLGPYERVASSLAQHGVPLLAVTKRAYDPRLEFVFRRLRSALSVRSVARDEAGAAMTMVRHLRKRGVLGIPMDLASRVSSITAPFFGAPARTAVGPARIALRIGAHVVVCTAARNASGELVLHVASVATSDLDATPAGELVLTTRINEELSRRIRAMPDAWPWMHPRFASNPGIFATKRAPRVLGQPIRETR
jgi:KDO2-lipid IV(A) lauroyltransferase